MPKGEAATAAINAANTVSTTSTAPPKVGMALTADLADRATNCAARAVAFAVRVVVV